jgi:photosystem II stability/assembly factor-like uncharacterized protein
MRISNVLFGVAVITASGCKKDDPPPTINTGSDTGSGGGGSDTGSGGGGTGSNKPPPSWLIGIDGTIAHVDSDGDVAVASTQVGSVQLNNIACRNQGEAWIVGNAGTVVYTNDGGDTWTMQNVPTTSDLRAVATQDDGPVYVVGNGSFLESDDAGTTWRQLGDGTTAFRSVAAATDASTVLAISDDGGLWSYDGGAVTRTAQLTGARAIAVSSDGMLALVVGTNAMWSSSDAGTTWTSLTVGQTISFDDVRLDEDGNGIAVGTGGGVALVQPSGEVIITHAGTADLHTVHVGAWGSVGSTGVAVGDGGQVYTTPDAGWTWQIGPSLGVTIYGVDSIGEGHR